MKKYFYILTLSFLFSFLLLLFTREPMQADSYSYDAIGRNLAAGRGYVDESGALTMDREPLYPFFLAAVYKIFGHNYFFVQLIQIALFLLTVILTYKIAALIFDRKITMYAMAITAFFPTLANYPSYILSETLFTFLLSLTVFFGIKAYLTDTMKYYLLLGLGLGLTALCKAIMLPFIFLVILWVIFLKLKLAGVTKLVMKIIIMTLVFMLLTIPWMYRNYLGFGSFSLRKGSEMPLCTKVLKLKYNFNDFKQNFIFIISENLGNKIFPGAVYNPKDFLFKEDIIAREKVLPELKKRGYSNEEIKGMMILEIARRPFKFIAVSFLDLLKMTQFTYLPLLTDQEYLIKNICATQSGAFMLFLLRGIFRLSAYLLLLFSIFGLWIKRDLWKNWLLVFILICYTNVLYSLIYGHGRYGVPLIPYYIILSTPLIMLIKEKIKSHV